MIRVHIQYVLILLRVLVQSGEEREREGRHDWNDFSVGRGGGVVSINSSSENCPLPPSPACMHVRPTNIAEAWSASGPGMNR